MDYLALPDFVAFFAKGTPTATKPRNDDRLFYHCETLLKQSKHSRLFYLLVESE
ncbi:hypothetical protein [Brachyspira sp.]|uniref:hypothetical protein n=1 Tax=Brachyspira sp. TaxID=1977261 RepID=UPI003D7E601D